ncbi:hypothetical protein WMY93_023032 [Mugilogobius chulae]|uniref:Uncharacterized protein n=1 Tax=Mugilogobius chulae TaxID=88201 RepID=A0AAW0NFK7_9GOBI
MAQSHWDRLQSVAIPDENKRGRAPLYKAALTLLASSHFRVLGLGSRRLEGPVPLGAPLAHVAALAADCVVQAGVLGSGGPGVSAATGGEGNTCVRDQNNGTGPLARRKPPPCFLWLTLLVHMCTECERL